MYAMAQATVFGFSLECYVSLMHAALFKPQFIVIHQLCMQLCLHLLLYPKSDPGIANFIILSICLDADQINFILLHHAVYI